MEYFDVESHPELMTAMLASSGGQRAVPVIVDGDKVTIGYGGT